VMTGGEINWLTVSLNDDRGRIVSKLLNEAGEGEGRLNVSDRGVGVEFIKNLSLYKK
jgi:hypothetical protein